MMKRLSLIAAVLTLAACASTGDEKVVLSDIEDAVCARDFTAADLLIDRMAAQGETGVAFHMLRAFALEDSGRKMSARPIYESVIHSRSMEPVSLDCSDLMYEGQAAAVADERLRLINHQLESMDVSARQVATTRIIRHPVRPPPPDDVIQAGPMATPPEPPPPPATSSGDNFAHLHSYKSESFALKAWKMLQRQHPAELGNQPPAIWKLDLPGKGTIYRLGAAFPNRKAARGFCKGVKAAGMYCVVMRR